MPPNTRGHSRGNDSDASDRNGQRKTRKLVRRTEQTQQSNQSRSTTTPQPQPALDAQGDIKMHGFSPLAVKSSESKQPKPLDSGKTVSEKPEPPARIKRAPKDDIEEEDILRYDIAE